MLLCPAFACLFTGNTQYQGRKFARWNNNNSFLSNQLDRHAEQQGQSVMIHDAYMIFPRDLSFFGVGKLKDNDFGTSSVDISRWEAAAENVSFRDRDLKRLTNDVIWHQKILMLNFYSTYESLSNFLCNWHELYYSPTFFRTPLSTDPLISS